MAGWTGPAVARRLVTEVLGDGFEVRGASCSFPGDLTSRLTVKAAKASVLEPGRGFVDFPGVELTVDLSVDFPGRVVATFGQFGFFFSLRSAVRFDEKGRPAHDRYRTDRSGEDLPAEIAEDVHRVRPLLMLTADELVVLMTTEDERLRFGSVDLSVHARNAQLRLIKAYLMAGRLGLPEAARRVPDRFRAGRPKVRLTEERRALVMEFARAGFDVAELSEALTAD